MLRFAQTCRTCLDHVIRSHWKIYKFKYLKPLYIKLYFKNSISSSFYFTIEGPAIADNILLLSADMENLRGLGQQAAMVCNTEDGRFKYLVSTLYGTRYRAAIVCPVRYPL